MLLRRAAISVALVTATTSAGAADVVTDACLTASEEAQSLRDDGKLLDARGKLVACGRAECPAVVRTDCARWLDELTPRIPAFVVRARDASGADLVDVRTVVDGVVRASSADGRSIEIDPGVHKVRFEHPGSAPVEQTVVARERERDRIIDVTFDGQAPVLVQAPAGAPRRQTTARPVPVLSIVLTGVAVASGASFAWFASSAKSDVDEMRARCAPSCPEDEIASARTDLTVANVSLAVGVIALGAAAVLYFTRPARPIGNGDVAVVRF